MKTKMFPKNINPMALDAIKSTFGNDEKDIVCYWAEQWDITSAGKRSLPPKSEYLFFLAKPKQFVADALNITQEVIVIFSYYKEFQPRSLEAYDNISQEFVEQRCEKLCYVIISGDNEIDKKLRDFLTNNENQVIIPFSYDDFRKNKDDHNFIRNKFRKYFYSRDLFDYSGPLKNGTFFYGRTELVSRIISEHKNNQNFGLFGLRKTGKTSIICDVERKSDSQDYFAVTIDCQDTSFNMRRWNNALFYVIDACAKKIRYTHEICENEFTIENASMLFKKYMIIFQKEINKSILLLFDEIENITFGKSSSSFWCNDLDFVYFWQSIRSNQQLLSNVFTFCIVGTNPKCIEDATILEKDNPIFNVFCPIYIPGFNYETTRDMVRSMGRIMGIKFEEPIFAKLFEDYGGHPFLIRRVCSQIAQLCPERPVTINRTKYIQAKETFNLVDTYFEMILEVLMRFYPDEYEMLKFLSLGDYENFNYFISEDPSMVTHLLGYGIIKQSEDKYDFQLDSIKEYIVRKNKNHIVLESDEEKWKHICVRRNAIETKLRKIVRQTIRIAYKTEVDAKEYIIKKLFGKEKEGRKYYSKPYLDLFDSKQSLIFFKNLGDLINGNWEYFSDYFGKQDIFLLNYNILNKEGRFDAHATHPTQEEMNSIAHSLDYLEKCIDNYDMYIS